MRRLHLPLTLTLTLTLLGACGLPEAELVLEANEERTGVPGAPGPFGVLRADRHLDSGAGATDAEVFVPDADGPFPVAVFVQGGLVETPRYRWIGEHLASRGFVALLPKHPFDLAFFAQDNALFALRGARKRSDEGEDPLLGGRLEPGPAAVLGHSLGGVVGSKAWQRTGPEEIGALVLLASVPDPADTFDGREGPVWSITGSADGRITPEEVVIGAEAFDEAMVAVVEGMNHFQLTDDASQGDLDSDGEPGIALETARERTLTLVDGLLNALTGRGPNPYEDPERWPEGVRLPE